MAKRSGTTRRKSDHIGINLDEEVHSGLTNGLECYRFKHRALPEMDLKDVNPSVTLFGKILSLPFFISSMTGGTEEAFRINQALAANAQAFNLAMGVGSQRAGLENQPSMKTFKVREFAPDILLFANLGAIQLKNSYTIEHCQRAVDAIEADALILHLNPLQEALMEEGDTNFSGLLEQIENICRKISVPVVVKEVGWGISADVARMLAEAGVEAIDVAGAGGTSWSEVEKHRMKSEERREVAGAFKDWGMPTAVCIQSIHQALPEIPLIASGGLHDGIDIAKCIALGAQMGGMARQFLLAAAESESALHQRISIYKKQFEVAMFSVGAKTIGDLQKERIFRIN